MFAFLQTFGLAIEGLLWVHINFWIICSSFVKKMPWYFDKDFIKSVDDLHSMETLAICILPIWEHGLSFHFLVSSSIFFTYSFQSIDLPPSWLNLFLAVLFFDVILFGTFLLYLSDSSLLIYSIFLNFIFTFPSIYW